jgi:hypothetical protein
MDTGVGDQVGLELSDIDVKGTVESERGSQGRDDLGDQSVQVGVGGPLNVEVAAADVIDGLVVEHNCDVGVLQEGVSRQDGVVGLNDGGGNLGRRVDGESELRLLSVIDGETLEQERSKSGSGSSSNGVEDDESLESSALVSKFPDPVEAEVDNLLSNGVMSTGEVVGGIFLSGDELFGMEQLSVGSGPDLIDNGGLEIEENGSGNVLSGTSLREEGVEGIVSSSDSLVRGHLAVRLDSVLEAEELPAGVSDLNTSLSNVDRNDFSHDEE